jgi:hypothetical protein
MAESLTDVCSQLSTLLEPEPDPPAVRDETWAEPFFYVDNTLYVFAGPGDEHRQHGDGKQDEERFTIVAAYAIGDGGERASKQRRQEVSVALDEKAHGYASIVRANRTYPNLAAPADRLWSDLVAVLNHNAIRTVGTNAVRGFTLTIRGWRLVGP